MSRKTILKSLLFLALILLPGIEKVQAQWSTIHNLGTGPTDGCFSFSLHGKGYVGGGSNGSHFYEYDTTTGSWTLKGNSPGNHIRGFAYSFVANGKGYVGCGDTTGTNISCSDMWMYDDTTNTWTQKASFPDGSRDAMLCFVINDTAYIGGGFDPAGDAWNEFYKYNPYTDTWTALANLPMGAVGFPASFVINNKGYLATGFVGSAESSGLWQYDPGANTWTAKADFPGAARQTAFGFALGNYGYVGGGMTNYTSVFNDMWRYNPLTDSWASAPDYPSLYSAWSTAFTLGNTAYVGTGSYFGTTSLFGTDSFKRYRGTSTTDASEPKTAHISIFPNPVGDYLNIACITGPDARITLSDITGREVKSFTGITTNVYVGDVPKGVYVLKCINTTGIYTEKIIKR